MTTRVAPGILNNLMMWLFIGIGCGMLLTIPITVVAARREAARARRLEQRARAAERLAELGTLTGGLAHEIKNPLSTVGLNLQLIQEDLRDLAGEAWENDRLNRVLRRFDTLNSETKRLRHTLEDFLNFAGRVRLERSRTNVHELIEELTDFFHPQAEAAGVRLRTQLSANDPVLEVDRDMLKQALLNLMINACQAMAQARSHEPDESGSDEMIIRTQLRRVPGHGHEMRIDVIDTGPGMEPEIAGKIFQPYFTRKSGGTGLGLPTTRRIIEEHGGTITCHSDPGRGTDFIISLPIRS